MPPERPDRLSLFVSLGVVLLLIAAFFLGGRFAYSPKPDMSLPSLTFEMPPIGQRPQVTVWISRDGLFVWNREKPAALDQLPVKIAGFKAMHALGYAEVSSDGLARFDQVVYALDELRKGGFPRVNVDTKLKLYPEDPYGGYNQPR